MWPLASSQTLLLSFFTVLHLIWHLKSKHNWRIDFCCFSTQMASAILSYTLWMLQVGTIGFSYFIWALVFNHPHFQYSEHWRRNCKIMALTVSFRVSQPFYSNNTYTQLCLARHRWSVNIKFKCRTSTHKVRNPTFPQVFRETHLSSCLVSALLPHLKIRWWKNVYKEASSASPMISRRYFCTQTKIKEIYKAGLYSKNWGPL